jgi:hypothetical protein
MKGIVFTEFMNMVEENWGIDIVDQLIDSTTPASGGIYTSVGTYEFEELAAYIGVLAGITKTEAPKLIYAFGRYLSESFSKKFKHLFDDAQGTIELLKTVDNHIHVEVRKLYPDAELPQFSYDQISDNEIVLRYESSRRLADLAHGLIEGTAEFYREKVEVSINPVEGSDNTIVDFTISKA